MSTLLRHCVRQLARSPGFALLSVFILGLGIAGTTLVFSILYGVYLRPLPFKDPDRLVDLDETAPQWQLRYVAVAYPDFCAWRAENQTFEALGAWSTGAANFVSGTSVERLEVTHVTYDLIHALGLQPVLGRGFTRDEDQPGAAHVAMLGYTTWQGVFGGASNVLGTVIRLDSEPHTVVGVLPKAADFSSRTGLWVPLARSETDGTSWFLSAVGRLKPGVTPEQARLDLDRIHKSRIDVRKVNEITSPTVQPLRERYLGDTKPVAGVLSATVVLVLVIACANVAALMLARGLARTREMGIRQALGASRWHLASQVLAESVVLSAVAGVGGVVAGRGLMRSALAWLPERLPPWITLDLDARFYAFSVGLTLVTALVFGWLPALQGSAPGGLHAVTGAASPRQGTSRRQRRSLSLLVVGEVAIALVLLVTCGLLGRALVRLQAADPGYRAENVLTYGISLPRVDFPEPGQQYQFFREHLDSVRALPGVVDASAVTIPPLTGHTGAFFEAEHALPRAPGAPNPVVLTRVAYPRYLETMGIRLVAGRTLEETDGAENGLPAVVVNEQLASFYWPGAEAVGKRIRYPGTETWLEVVGVVKDVSHYGATQPMRPGVYLPAARDPRDSMVVVVRTAVPPNGLLPVLRERLARTHPNLPMHAVNTLSERLRESLWLPRFVFWMTGVFAAVALVLAVGGIYGVISFTVAQRTPELGVRLALGARRVDLLQLVLGDGMRLAGFGVMAGLLTALVLAPLLRSLLFGINPVDPVTLTVFPGLVLLVSLMACAVPGWRAARLDPAQALRSE